MKMSKPDMIWNRAAENNTPRAAAGDRALTDMLQIHGLIMNGGVLNAIEITEEAELGRALAGYEFFGLVAIRSLLDQARILVQSGSKLGPHEARLDHEYMKLIPNDSYLSAAFERRLAAAPDDFSSL
jgi:hypothetical protein